MNILHLEDDSNDAELVRRLLSAAWPESKIKCVSGRPDYRAELGSCQYDLILADCTLPRFAGMEALDYARELAPWTPFIFVTGTLSEQDAIEAVERGATDYVFKDQLSRLVIVVRRAMRESRERREALTAAGKVRQLNAELERHVQERTAGLEAAIKELEAFSYSVSHDLRAPLRGIDGFARALQEECGATLDVEGRRLVATIRGETRRMGQLIDDLLAFSRVGRRQLDSAPVDMTELARSAFQNITESIPEPHPTLQLHPLPEAFGDRALLRQVFANLLGNAVKFSSRQAAPVIEVTGWSGTGGKTYCIKDNGVGFDPRFGHKLFGVFQRLHSQDEFEGTGVGLALVRRIVERHGGKTWGESKLHEGAQFYFTLPEPIR